MILWRRHKVGCEAAARCRCRKEQKRECHCCRCPIWIDGFEHKARRSLGIGDWSRAERKRAEIEAAWEKGEPSVSRKSEPVSIETACDDFLQDAKARDLRDSTRYKYELLFNQLKKFARDKGLRFLPELDVDMIRAFRASWTNQNFSAQKKLEALRTFFRFAQESGAIVVNPAAKLKGPKIRRPQILPYTSKEMDRILAACDFYRDGYGRTNQQNARRLRAFVLLLRRSGLRIGDAVSLPRDRIVNGTLSLIPRKRTPLFAACFIRTCFRL